MGLFDLFTKDGKFLRMSRRMQDAYAQAEDRDVAARWLAEEGSERAISALLTRFDIAVSNQMKDRTEKDQVFELLVGLGGRVSAPLHAWLQRCKHYVFPLRLLSQLDGEEAAIEAALGVLEGPVGRSTFEPERRKELLTWLAEKRHPSIGPRVVRFLANADEETRYMAAEALLGQEGDVAREPLLAVLGNAQEESTRMRHRIAYVFAQKGWSVGEGALNLPNGFVRQGERLVAR